MDGDELLGVDHEDEPGDEERQQQAAERITQLLEEYPTRVFFGRQLEVMLEGSSSHWITNRAMRSLEGRVAHLEPRILPNGSRITLCWHRSYRYPKREATRVLQLVSDYSNHVVGQALGERGESLVLDGFARNQFLLHGRGVKAFGGRSWDATGHDLDFVFERDGRPYGVEVKNTLGYLPKEELDVKVALAQHLGVTPVFVCRMLPKSWIFGEERRRLLPNPPVAALPADPS